MNSGQLSLLLVFIAILVAVFVYCCRRAVEDPKKEDKWHWDEGDTITASVVGGVTFLMVVLVLLLTPSGSTTALRDNALNLSSLFTPSKSSEEEFVSALPSPISSTYPSSEGGPFSPAQNAFIPKNTSVFPGGEP